jgi:excisionase family DNA binding protein
MNLGESPFLTVDEAAERLRVHPATIRTMIRNGRMPAVKFGRMYRVKKDDVDNAMTTAPAVAPQPVYPAAD